MKKKEHKIKVSVQTDDALADIQKLSFAIEDLGNAIIRLRNMGINIRFNSEGAEELPRKVRELAVDK